MSQSAPPDGRRANASQLRTIIEALAAVGADSDRFVAFAGLDRQQLTDKDCWVSVHELDRVTRLAIDFSGMPGFGLQWGTHSMMYQCDLLPTLFAQAPTLKAGIELSNRYHRLLMDHLEMSLRVEGDRARLVYDSLAMDPVARRTRTEFLVCSGLRMLRYFGATNAAISDIRFDYCAPPYADQYRALLGTALWFDAAETSIEFDARLLTRENSFRNAELHRRLLAEAEVQLAAVLPSGSLQQRLRHWLAQRSGAPSIDEAAEALGCSARTLRRRLQLEGTSYAALLQTHLSEAAKHILVSRPDQPMQRVADRLGFSSASVFQRAFKRWTGEPPQAYRKRSLSSERSG